MTNRRNYTTKVQFSAVVFCMSIRPLFQYILFPLFFFFCILRVSVVLASGGEDRNYKQQLSSDKTSSFSRYSLQPGGLAGKSPKANRPYSSKPATTSTLRTLKPVNENRVSQFTPQPVIEERARRPLTPAPSRKTRDTDFKLVARPATYRNLQSFKTVLAQSKPHGETG